IGWRYKWNYPGRYFLKSKAPHLSNFINRFNERKLSVVFKNKIKEIQPDVVHSFVMQSGTLPLSNVMRDHPHIKWIYSSWGSDLFFYQKNKEDLDKILKVLPAIHYLFTDCQRDY